MKQYLESNFKLLISFVSIVTIGLVSIVYNNAIARISGVESSIDATQKSQNELKIEIVQRLATIEQLQKDQQEWFQNISKAVGAPQIHSIINTSQSSLIKK